MQIGDNYDDHGKHLALLTEAVENLVRQHRYNDAWAILHVEVDQVYKPGDAQIIWAHALDQLIPKE